MLLPGEGLWCSVVRMDEKRTERFSVSLTPAVLAKLDAYAAEHRWSRSAAVAELIECGIDAGRPVLEAHYSYVRGGGDRPTGPGGGSFARGPSHGSNGLPPGPQRAGQV